MKHRYSSIVVAGLLLGLFLGYRLDWFLYTYYTYTTIFAVIGLAVGTIVVWFMSHSRT